MHAHCTLRPDRRYAAIHRQWSAPYRLLYRWAWRRKCCAIAEGSTPQGGDGAAHGGSLLGRYVVSLLERLLFGTVAASLGGRLRYVLVCDRDMDAEARPLPAAAALCLLSLQPHTS